MPLGKIKQTSKTLLLEEFCVSDSVPDLYTLLRNEDVRQKSEFFNEAEKLEVWSYEEFVKKFMPSVWEWMEESGDPACPMNFRYSLEKPEGNVQAHEMKLSGNEFYAMVMDLYTKKGISGESNLGFDYSRVAELLSPKKVLENAKQLRRDLQYIFRKMQELGEGSKTEKNECIRKIKKIRTEIVEQYKDSFTGKIKLALADTDSKLAALPYKGDAGESRVTDGEPLRLPCKVSFDERGDLEIIPIEDNHVAVGREKSIDSGKELAIAIGKDFDKYGGEKNSYIKNLVISNYCGDSSAVVQLDRAELVKKRNQYMAIYKASQEQFIRAVSSAVEKMLDVKAFFEQASVQGKRLQAPVVVANCKANKLVENEKVMEDFTYFIKEAGREITDKKIWFAVIPAIGDADLTDMPDDAEESLWDDLDLDEENEQSTMKTSDGESLVSLNALKVILNILREGKVTAFFNYRANEATGFGRLSDDAVEMYRKKLEAINGNDYALFCYPNLTVLPKKKTAIEIGMAGEEGNEKREFLDIPGIYVDASYVAAGLVIGTQNPEYLKKKGYEVSENTPCVRFDLEQGDSRYRILTTMNREGKVAWPSDVEENIGRDSFGFCFCGNTQFYKGEQVKNTYVYVARNMHKDKSGKYDPIYTRLTMDFIMQYLRICSPSIGNKFKESDIEKFIKVEVGKWKRDAASSDVKVNSILHDGEDVIFEGNMLRVKFRNTETEIDIDIDKQN